ncbi:MAG: helix-turn-helix domain-containing protein [Lachnospiraceae bacterium]|nr:helix-turn-helix domain-containing protein [Lachnospiraceae bacterium]MDD3614818.1 helix-turn-helix domain-containing protein [Lachnospiraceae bacterium]
MSDLYNSIMAGLNEAVEDAKGTGKRLNRRIVTVIPVKEYNADEIKKIRKNTGFSQKVFADYMGVSVKTVEAWEAGTNHPSGTASRILSMMEMDLKLVDDFPFVQSVDDIDHIRDGLKQAENEDVKDFNVVGERLEKKYQNICKKND